MGLWGKVKGWLNIGGVKVLLWKYSEPLRRSDPVITGAVLLKTKSPRTVLSVEIRLVEEHTYKKNDETKTDTTVLGRFRFPESDPGIGYPLEMKPEEDREQPFTFRVAMVDRLRDQGGVLGSVAKAGAFFSQDRVEHYLIAEADVQSTPLDPNHKVKMPITD
jgi:hypothetical protein